MEVDCTVQHISYRESGILSPLALALQENQASIQHYIHRPFALDSFEQQIQEKKESYQNREVLVDVLTQQYAEQKLKKAEKESVALLKEGNTFTITTGHQLCLFGGPLYFVYKIAHTINLCKQLKETYPSNNFVPIFWMASEDHDYQEIQSVFVKGNEFTWEENHNGEAVGRMSAQHIPALVDEILKLFPEGGSKQQLEKRMGLWIQGETPTEIVRNIVRDLFGAYGVLALDGDAAALKGCMKAHFEKELFEQFAYQPIQDTSLQLEKEGFKVQVNPREINLFYLDDSGKRERIEKTANGFVLVDSQTTFSESEIREELHSHPERFSPNVVLRPLYQEVILPNLLYLGGGGEMAYWMQLKHMFSVAEVPFPILAVRNSALFLSQQSLDNFASIGLNLQDLFADEHSVIQRIVDEFEGNAAYSVDIEREELNQWMEALKNRAAGVDEGLSRYVGAREAWQNQFLDALQKKLFRKAKQRQEKHIRLYEHAKAEVYPNGALQERKEGMLYHLYQKGDAFVEQLLGALDASNQSLTVIVE